MTNDLDGMRMTATNFLAPPRAFTRTAPRRQTPSADGSRAIAVETSHGRAAYLTVLGWAFTLFNSMRLVAYLPTVWTLWQSGDSSQHSLWTWCTWLGANVTMSLWLIERNGSRLDRAAAVSTGNAVMCLVVIVLIVLQRM